MNDFFGKMPLDAPLHIRNPRRLYLLNIIYFKIGGNTGWTGRIETIVAIANEYTPISQPQWTRHQVDYALRELKKSGWIVTQRKGRNKPMTYLRSRPQDLLINLEEKVNKPPIETKVPMIKHYNFETYKQIGESRTRKSDVNVWEEFQLWSKGKVSSSTYQSIIESKQSSDLPDRISNIWNQWQNTKKSA